MKPLLITNARLISYSGIIYPAAVLIEGKKIARIFKRRPKKIPGAKVINARGNFLSPGFIDLHIHGDILKVSRAAARGGTTSFLPTLQPQAAQEFLGQIKRLKNKLRQKFDYAKPLGLRLEGPFLNPAMHGALPKQHLLRKINRAFLKQIIQAAGDDLKIMTIAPELSGAREAIKALKKQRVIASLGHTSCTYHQALKGVRAGITHVTHCFNRLGSFSARKPGALGAALYNKRLACEIILDGIHVNPLNFKLLLLCKNKDDIMLVTDSTENLADRRKIKAGGAFRLKDGTLAGSALKMIEAVANAVQFGGLTLPQAVKMAALNPARLLGIDLQKGSIASGKDADIVVFDKNFKVKTTIVEGKCVV